MTAEFDLISCKAIRSRGRLTILYLFIGNTVTSIATHLLFIQAISIFQRFLGNWNKSSLDATAQSLFIVLKDHQSAETITLTLDSYENLLCQAGLEQGYEIENVAVTEGTDFSYKPAQLVTTKFIDCESKKELLSELQHVRNTDLH